MGYVGHGMLEMFTSTKEIIILFRLLCARSVYRWSALLNVGALLALLSAGTSAVAADVSSLFSRGAHHSSPITARCCDNGNLYEIQRHLAKPQCSDIAD